MKGPEKELLQLVVFDERGGYFGPFLFNWNN